MGPDTSSAASSIRNSRSIGTNTLAFILASLVLFAATGYGATYTSVLSGNWHNADTWGSASYPTSLDNVIIASGTTVTVSSALDAVCASLTINGTLSTDPGATATNPLTCSSFTLASTGILNLALSISKKLTINGTMLNAGVINHTTGTLWTRDWINNGTYTAANGVKVQIPANTSGGKTICGSGTNNFKTLIVSGGGTITAYGDFSVAELLNIQAGTTLDMSTFVLTGLTDLSNQTSGSGILRTSNTSTTPIPAIASSRYNFTVDYAAGSQTIAGADYMELTVSGSGTKTLANNTRVWRQLNMDSFGTVQLGVAGDLDLTLGVDSTMPGILVHTDGQINGTTGSFIRWFNRSIFGFGDARGYFPLGNGANNRSVSISTFNTNLGTNYPGTIAVRHDATSGFTDIPSFTDDGLIVNRHNNMNWTISTDNLFEAYNLELRVQASGLEGLNILADLRLMRAADVVGSNGGSAGTITDPVVTRMGLESDGLNLGTLSNTFYIGSNSSVNPLPVELVSFSARVQERLVELKWKTATELNNYGFEVQRNENQIEEDDESGWRRVGFVAGNGTSVSPKSYTFKDPLIEGSNSIRYRLMQIDRDGTTNYSTIVEVVTGAVSFNLSQNYPNPFATQTTIAYSLLSENLVTLKVYDVLGNVVQTLVEESQGAGSYVTQFDPAQLKLKPGCYLVSLTAGSTVENRTMIYLP